MNGITELIRFFQSGGIFMFPLLFILAIGTAIVIERVMVLMRSRCECRDLWRKLSNAISSNRLDVALSACTPPRFAKPLHRVLRAGIKGMKTSNTREDVQGSLEEALMTVTPKLEARLHYLPNLANVATLLGLLGTIMGLIDAFTAVGAADPAQKAAMLAQGISKAMSTTAFGLVVAIPLLLIYTFLQARTNQLVDLLDEYALKLLNLSGQMFNKDTSQKTLETTETARMTTSTRRSTPAPDTDRSDLRKATSMWQDGEIQTGKMQTTEGVGRAR
ncbi:MAG: MotA/TolQ/ExbB proton channel family protein [Nitrospiria bacterium]